MTQPNTSSSRGVLITSLVRTLVPALAGGGLGHLVAAVLTWLGFDATGDLVSRVFEYVFIGVYYLAVRYLETHQNARWGWLLGMAKAPVYSSEPAPSPDAPAEVLVEPSAEPQVDAEEPVEPPA